MTIRFWKMHGAGNDFIMIDDRAGTFPAQDLEWIGQMAQRRTGVGSEGVILIQRAENPKTADFRMRFFNPDGSEVDMCGNGARCIARLAYDLKVAGGAMKFETGAGLIQAAIEGGQVRLRMTRPRAWRLNATIELPDATLHYSFVNSGVPHVVIEVPHLEEEDVEETGAAIRNHRDFAPAGTNVNFVHVTGPRDLRIRTYERGVEGETLACGTGIVAAALICGKLGKVQPPVLVTSASGDVLEVDYRLTDDGVEEVTMLGPAVYVFEGTLTYGA